MSAPAFRGRGGRGNSRGGRGGFTSSGPAQSARFEAPTEQEADDVRELRSKYSKQLQQTKEIYSDWSDEDILNALNESAGDAELTILRISEGHAQQWGAVKPKKTKKEIPAPAPYESAAPVVISNGAGRGGFGDRGGRGGRGGFETARGARGGRGLGRGGRGGAVPAVTTRAPYSNGDSQPTPDAFAAIPSPPLSVPAWGPSAPKWGPDGSIAAPAVESIASAAASDWGNATEVSTTATIGWGDEVPDETGKGEEIDRPETPIARAVLNDGWGDAATPEVESVVESAKLRQPSKIVVPGSKISWAQITRPVSPPKPLPPVVVVPAPAPIVIATPSPPAPIAAPVELEPVPAVVHQISIPEIDETPIAAAPTWNEAPAPGPLDAWATPTPAPLGVGAGWADSVSAAPDSTHQQYAQVSSAEIQAHLPSNDINTAGPIAIASPPIATELSSEYVENGAGPPGLAKRASLGRQESTNDRAQAVGVQFGSLSMYDGQNGQQHQQVEQQQSHVQEAPIQQYSQHYQQQHEQYQQYQQAPPQHLSQQEQGVQTSSYGQQNLYSQQQQPSAFSNRYAPAGAEPYAPFKNDVASPYYQQSSQSPIPSAPGAPSPYAPFSYDQYGQATPAATYQNPVGLPRADDPKSSPSVASQTQQQQVPQQQGYPGMMPYYYSGYSQGYPVQQQYGQYGGMPQQQQQQQYPYGGRNVQGQYSQGQYSQYHQQQQQPQQSFRQGNQQQSPYGYAQSPYVPATQQQQQQQQQQPQPNQNQEHKEYNSKDFESSRSFF